MRMSRLHAPTLKEAPKEAEVPSHQLLLRGGFIRKLSAGIYDFLPLGVRSLTKIANIVRDELNKAGAQEVLLPVVQPAELWQESTRWDFYGPELLRFEDRKGASFCLGPTHEEVIVDLVRRDVNSYKQLPVNLYQIQAKFRDEIRPRAGLMRGREFLMKDGYSFDASEEAARQSYVAMRDAYVSIFRRCGLDFRVVDADSGNIGGSLSQEFQVLAETGEDSIVACTNCSYSANVEKAEIRFVPISGREDIPPLESVDTPGAKAVENVAAFLKVPTSEVAKTLLFVADGRPVAVVVRGDHDVNEVKVKAALGATQLALAGEDAVVEATRAPVGFAGPVGLLPSVMVMVDHAVGAGMGWVTGANAADQHLRNVVVGRDFTPNHVGDLRLAKGGDACPRCGEEMKFYRGIEVGHVFFLGTKYSEPMKCTFLDDQGKARPMVMGCYGIGVSRVLAAAVEQHHDENGIRWPLPIAPFEVCVVSLNHNDQEVLDAAEALYKGLIEAGVDVVYDDRNERPGVKLKDAELIGHPFTVVVGKRGLAEGALELRTRADGAVVSIPATEAVAAVKDALGAERRRLVGSLA